MRYRFPPVEVKPVMTCWLGVQRQGHLLPLVLTHRGLGMQAREWRRMRASNVNRHARAFNRTTWPDLYSPLLANVESR